MAEFEGLVEALCQLVLISEKEAAALIDFKLRYNDFESQDFMEKLESDAEEAGEVWRNLGEGQQKLALLIIFRINDVEEALS